jgi:hypothetical protein
VISEAALCSNCDNSYLRWSAPEAWTFGFSEHGSLSLPVQQGALSLSAPVTGAFGLCWSLSWLIIRSPFVEMPSFHLGTGKASIEPKETTDNGNVTH